LEVVEQVQVGAIVAHRQVVIRVAVRVEEIKMTAVIILMTAIFFYILGFISGRIWGIK
jgi:hypothetical protein